MCRQSLLRNFRILNNFILLELLSRIIVTIYAIFIIDLLFHRRVLQRLIMSLLLSTLRRLIYIDRSSNWLLRALFGGYRKFALSSVICIWLKVSTGVGLLCVLGVLLLKHLLFLHEHFLFVLEDKHLTSHCFGAVIVVVLGVLLLWVHSHLFALVCSGCSELGLHDLRVVYFIKINL